MKLSELDQRWWWGFTVALSLGVSLVTSYLFTHYQLYCWIQYWLR